MTIYTPHTPAAPSDCCEIVAVTREGKAKVEIVRNFASGLQRTGDFKVYFAHELRADGGLGEIKRAMDLARSAANPGAGLPPEQKLAHQIRVTGRVPYDPSRED